MLLDRGLGELLRHEAGHGRLPFVLTLYELEVAHFDESVLLYPDVALHGLELPLHLVLVRLLLLLLPAVQDGVRDYRACLIRLGLLGVLLRIRAPANVASDAVDAPFGCSCLLLVHGELGALELQAFLVIVARKAPHDVLGGSFLHVLLQMVEGVLGHIGHAQTSRFPNGALSGLLLTHQHFDGRGLARTVGTNHGHAAHLRDRQAHVHDGGLVLGGVLEGHVIHSQHHLAAALYTLHGTRLGEGELHDLVAELEVGLLFGVLLHELGQASALDALERLQLAVLEVNDVCAHLVQEGREVRSADDAAGKRLEPVFQPLDVVNVKMPCWLVQHEHVGVHELGCTELHLHLPTA
mmetsp:Transcript_38606/g.89500  ORF Transcript_38606/g.89500 Transcript_38606/m.89500 type:complete len:352 (-) Transcript_38606:1609-2664(-)